MTDSDRFPRVKPARPKSRGNAKLLAVLFLLFVTLLVILFFRSSISKIDSIDISGNRLTAADQIGQALGVHKGDLFFKLSAGEIEANVLQLHTVKKASVTKHFPGRVDVHVTEFPQVAVEAAPGGSLSVILANGYAVPLKGDASLSSSLPVLTGWDGMDKLKAKLCAVLAELPGSSLQDVSEIQPIPSKSYPDKIKIYTRSRFEVTTTVGYLADKLPAMNTIIAKEKPGKITMLEAITYAPYAEGAENGDGEGQAP